MSDARILVVEDEPSIREILSLYLRRAGYQVTVVGDGREALTVLSSQLPDLVVLDLMLPEVDGLEITPLADRGDVAQTGGVESDEVANGIGTDGLLLDVRSSLEQNATVGGGVFHGVVRERDDGFGQRRVFGGNVNLVRVEVQV